MRAVCFLAATVVVVGFTAGILISRLGLASDLASRYSLEFLSEAGVIWFTDSPGAIHLSADYMRSEPAFLKTMCQLPLPPESRRLLRRKVRLAYHSVAEFEWRAGNLVDAWRCHLRSLMASGGWRHLLFTRYLFRRRAS